MIKTHPIEFGIGNERKIYTIRLFLFYGIRINYRVQVLFLPILLAKITAVQNEVAPSYYRERGLYFLAVVLAATIVPYR